MKTKKLADLIDKTYQVIGNPNINIAGIEYDSRKVKRGDLFIALSGKNTDGRKYCDEAIRNGAVAILTDKEVPGAITVVAEDVLQAMATVSKRFYGNPDEELLMVGVTGTNGKTTITYFLESIFRKAKMPCGVIGTINYRFGKKILLAPNTTPQSSDVYQMLREMKSAKTDVAVMEVSSHALALERVKDVEYDIAIFTNLTRDHLDFHKNMDDYFDSKSKLFTNLISGKKTKPKFAVINADDEWGQKLFQVVPKDALMTYGIDKTSDVQAKNISINDRETTFQMITSKGTRAIHLHVLGKHNIYNALGSAAAALCAGIDLDTIVAGLETIISVPGRLEKVQHKADYSVLVDYAHTDDALHNVLVALKELEPNRIITVFGCGGDRDRSKRPLMGEVATELSDYVFVTSDNPRSEDPSQIILDIEVGIRRKQRDNYQVIADREQAIAAAINMASKGDIILLAGKGHETYQILGDRRVHFNDAEIANKYMTMYSSKR